MGRARLLVMLRLRLWEGVCDEEKSGTWYILGWVKGHKSRVGFLVH